MADGARMDSISDQQNSEPLNLTILHDLALELAGEWGLSENDMDVYFPPDQASTQPPMMIVAAANQTKERVVGVCHTVEGNSAGETLLGLGDVAQRYLMRYEHKDPLDVDISRVQIKLLAVIQSPKHGQMTMLENDLDQRALYLPDIGYYGKDRIEVTVAVGKDIVRVVYNLVVQRKAVDNLQPAEERKLCPRGIEWKISEASLDESDPVAAERIAGMNILRTAASQNLSFADLAGSAVGETTGTGASAQITLDTTAADHGWYIATRPT